MILGMLGQTLPTSGESRRQGLELVDWGDEIEEAWNGWVKCVVSWTLFFVESFGIRWEGGLLDWIVGESVRMCADGLRDERNGSSERRQKGYCVLTSSQAFDRGTPCEVKRL